VSQMSKELTIIGGGITGLTAAYIAAKQGVKVRVLEAGSTFGGLLQTFPIAGSRLEFYYHHFFTHDAEIHWLVKELGISRHLIYKKTKMATFRNQKHFDFNGPADLLAFSPMNIADKIRFAWSSLYLGKWAKWQDYEQVPALDWFYKNAGNSATESLWKPMLEIKFGPYAPKVPLSWMIGRMRQRMSSRKSGDERLGYLKGSLDTLLQALLNKLTDMGVELIPNAPVTSLQLEHNESLTAVQSHDTVYAGGDFLFTVPAPVVAKLLPLFCSLKDQLDAIRYFGAVCVILEMNKPLGKAYWTNIADPGYDFGGVIEHTQFMDPSHYQGKHIAYLSRYFDTQSPLFNATPDQIKGKMLPQLKYIYRDFDPYQIEDIHVFKTPYAAPLCDLNFSKKVPPCKTEFQHLYLVNMAHIYPDERSANNSIRIAAEALKTMGLHDVDVPYGSSLSGKIGFGSNTNI